LISARYRTLDHWRAVAALWVLLYHAHGRWLEGAVHPWFGWVQIFARRGYLGVSLFFVISGYCISARLHRDNEGQTPIRHFLVDRLLRIFPTYWVALAVTLLLGLATRPFNHTPLYATPFALGVLPATTTRWLSNLLLMEPWLQVPPILNVSWTLTYELAFYALAAACLGLFRLTRTIWPSAMLVGALLTLSLWQGDQHQIPGITRLPEFMCGAVLYATLTAGGKYRYWLAVAGTGGLVCAGLAAQASLITATGFMLVLLVLAPADTWLVNLRCLRALGYCGLFSYSLYLIHVSVATRVMAFIGYTHPPTTIAFYAWLVIAMASAILAGYALYVAVEKPVERWRHAFWARRTASA
jgi:peptidoglycan/LPS O-acetylase OafA/YrhL